MRTSSPEGTPRPVPVRPLPVRLVLAFWSIPVLFSATQHIALGAAAGGGPGVAEAFLRPAPGWFTWALFSLLVVRLADRFPPGRAGWRALLVHAPVAAAMALVHIGVLVAANRIGSPQAAEWSWARQYGSFASGIFHVDLLIYAAIVALREAVEARRASREREVTAARLRAQLAAARLQALRAQLNPHFLFNSLNAAVTLVRTGDNRNAAHMLTRLGELLRQSLNEGATQEVTLDDELRLLAGYLDIEQVRFGGRLQVEVEVSAELRHVRVPSMILQPLVENAIRHGIETSPGAGRVAVRGRRSGETVELEIVDDAGRWGDAAGTMGIGLRNTQQRLQALYPMIGRLEVESGDGNTTARVVVPFHAE